MRRRHRLGILAALVAVIFWLAVDNDRMSNQFVMDGAADTVVRSGNFSAVMENIEVARAQVHDARIVEPGWMAVMDDLESWLQDSGNDLARIETMQDRARERWENGWGDDSVPTYPRKELPLYWLEAVAVTITAWAIYQFVPRKKVEAVLPEI